MNTNENNLPAGGDRRDEARERLRGMLNFAQFERLPAPVRMRVRAVINEPDVDHGAIYDRFGGGERAVPAVPTPVEIRTVVADMGSGRINTDTRFGRKQQWKTEQSQKYVEVLLERKFQVDAIAISRRREGSAMRDRAINGNNRLRSILKFVRNLFGIQIGDLIYYYSQIPEDVAAKPSMRNRAHVLPADIRALFDSSTILFNIRQGLTEREEIDWYHQLNQNIVPHTEGHLLVSSLCEENELNNAFLDTFPAMKPRIQVEIRPEDANSLGAILERAVGVAPNPMHEDDKKEDAAQALAHIFGILGTGGPYDGGFRDGFNSETLRDNINTMAEIFQSAVISDEMKNEFRTPVMRKTHLPQVWQARYLLGPMAWSIYNEGRNVIDTWVHFLETCEPGKIKRVSLDPLAEKSGRADKKEVTHREAWELMRASLG